MYKNILFVSLMSVANLFLNGCETSPPQADPKQTLDVMRILTQVNDAIESSIEPTNKDFPALTSVTLDLQVAVTTSVDASLKFPVVLTVGGKGSNEKLHQITLTFTPNASKRTPSSEGHESKLASAIRAVYQTVAHPNGAFQLHNGIVKLQCTLKSELDGSINVLGLVPIQSNASLANQTIQTLTLNFGNPVATRVMSESQQKSETEPVTP
jgi:hypothetical protein